MTASQPYVMMAINNAWANETLYAALTGLTKADFTAHRPGFLPSLCATMNHILLVDRYYIGALEGQGRPYQEIAGPEITDPFALAAAQQVEDARLIAFCRRLDAGILDETRTTPRKDGVLEENVAALLLHLFQHQVHHRGQAHVQLQDAGKPPPQLDDFHLEFGRVESARAWLER